MKQKKKITNKTFVLTAVIGSMIIVAMVTREPFDRGARVRLQRVELKPDGSSN